MKFCVLACLTHFAHAHSWIDTIYASADPSVLGYPRNYAGHDASTSITEYKVLERDATLPVCGPSQQTDTYSTQYPRLVVAAGSAITATYLENGHVTKDRLPPDQLPHPGNYSWYISAKSGSLTTFGDLTDATRLSGPSSFDDGKCAVDAAGIQGRQGPIPCLSHFTIPSSFEAGVYQLVWWWDFTKLTAVDPGYTEYYTTCLDIEVTAAESVNVLDAVYAMSSSAPRYANVSFTPAARVAAAAASVLPIEKDVLVVTNQHMALTSTYFYEHPVAAIPTEPVAALAVVLPETTSSISAVSSTSSAPDYLATMYVNPIDGSLQPYNVVAEDDGVLQEVQVSIPQAAASGQTGRPAAKFNLAQKTIILSTATTASTTTLTSPSSIVSSASQSAAAVLADEETVTELVTIYVPTYVTVDEPCASTSAASTAGPSSSSIEQHTTITMTTTVTMSSASSM